MELLQFDLSIPCRDLDETEGWYVDGLGCCSGRGPSGCASALSRNAASAINSWSTRIFSD